MRANQNLAVSEKSGGRFRRLPGARRARWGQWPAGHWPPALHGSWPGGQRDPSLAPAEIPATTARGAAGGGGWIAVVVHVQHLKHLRVEAHPRKAGHFQQRIHQGSVESPFQPSALRVFQAVVGGVLYGQRLEQPGPERAQVRRAPVAPQGAEVGFRGVGLADAGRATGVLKLPVQHPAVVGLVASIHGAQDTGSGQPVVATMSLGWQYWLISRGK